MGRLRGAREYPGGQRVLFGGVAFTVGGGTLCVAGAIFARAELET